MPEASPACLLLCPVCQSQSSTKLRVDSYKIEHCTNCTHQFADFKASTTHVAHQFDDAYFHGGGTSGYADYLASQNLICAHGARYAKLINKSLGGPPNARNRMLDVGCAAGFIMRGFSQHGWSPVGIEPNAVMANHAKSNGQEVFQTTLETVFDDPTATLAEESFDLVTLIQVIAHLPCLDKSMDNLWRLVRTEGHVLVETWNSASFTAKALGVKWHEYSPPNVLHFFTPDSLDKLLQQSGFKCVTGGRQIKRIDLGHARSIFDYKYGNTAWGKLMLQSSSFLSKDLAIPYPSEDLFWRLYKKRD